MGSWKSVLLGTLSQSALLPLLAEVALGQLSPIEPRICIGLRRELPNIASSTDLDWGMLHGGLCPENWAVYAVETPGGPRSDSGERLQVSATCCPLPAVDILTDEHILSATICPKDFVATSASDLNLHKPNSSLLIRCTKINTIRYQLAMSQPGVYWGLGFTSWRHSRRIFHSEIPAAIRTAVGRREKYSWITQGCIGYPFGSLFGGKAGKRCDDLEFRQLQFRGIPGDPPPDTAVVMYPDCPRQPDPIGGTEKCKTTP